MRLLPWRTENPEKLNRTCSFGVVIKEVKNLSELGWLEGNVLKQEGLISSIAPFAAESNRSKSHISQPVDVEQSSVFYLQVNKWDNSQLLPRRRLTFFPPLSLRTGRSVPSLSSWQFAWLLEWRHLQESCEDWLEYVACSSCSFLDKDEEKMFGKGRKRWFRLAAGWSSSLQPSSCQSQHQRPSFHSIPDLNLSQSSLIQFQASTNVKTSHSFKSKLSPLLPHAIPILKPPIFISSFSIIQRSNLSGSSSSERNWPQDR